MNKQQLVVAVLVVAVVAAGACAFAFMDHDNKSASDSTDFAGYEIKTVENFDNGIVAVGQDSFRWVTYFGLSDKCVMVDINDKTNYMGKSFMYVGKALALKNTLSKDLKFTSTNCGITVDDAATIISLKPSIMVVPYEFENDYPNEMKAIRNAGINVVHIGYIYTFLEKDTFSITDDLDRQISVLSKAFDMGDRGNELRATINNTVEDIRTIASRATERKTGYVGALAYNGAHGAESSMPYYMPFALANVDNIMGGDNATYVGSGVTTYSATKIGENIKSGTILFLDGTGVFQCIDQTSIAILKMFSGHDAFISFPYIWTGINYENVLISAYQILHDAYGLLTDEELTAKINAVFDGFLGAHDSNRSETAATLPAPDTTTSIRDDMSAMYEKKRGNPVYGKITISSEGAISFA